MIEIVFFLFSKDEQIFYDILLKSFYYIEIVPFHFFSFLLKHF